MCGIAGVVSLNADINPVDVAEVNKMIAMLRHRGPDSFGEYHDSYCSLGNTRLNIIDPSAKGHLPMTNQDGSIVVAYNGEITNFLELRKEFKLDDKYAFYSRTDTEVLIHLYEEMGIECLQHFSGMFAFTLYDKNLRKCYIVRDFYGTRPLFYISEGSRLYFASEIKSFLELKGFNGVLNKEALYHYFTSLYIPGTYTPYEVVHELEGGHLIEVDIHAGVINKREYYKIHFSPEYSMTESDAADGFYQVMRDSVSRNLISDAPVGLTLSGGLDTSVMVALAMDLNKSKGIHTFSLKVNESSHDESKFQRIMADRCGSHHHEIAISAGDILDNITAQVAFMDEPMADGASVPHFLLAKEAKKYVSVLLSGEGGDEISNAYETHGACILRKNYNRFVPVSLRRLLYSVSHQLPISYKKLSLDFIAKRFTEGARMGVPEAHVHWRHAFSDNEKKLLMTDVERYSITSKLYADMYHSLDFSDDLDRIAYIDMKYFFIGDLMMKNDRMFMAHSIEGRFPFMDRKVVEFTSKIPVKYKVKGGGLSRRCFQKKAFASKLPKEILRRSGFGIELPYGFWFDSMINPLLEKYFTKSRIEKTGILNYSYLERIRADHLARKEDNARKLWGILNFLIWHDLFVDTKNYKLYLSSK